MKNNKLRIAWMIPNVFCYLLFFGFSTFVLLNVDELQMVNLLGRWIFTMVILLSVSIFGSYRIRTWIKEGKM